MNDKQDGMKIGEVTITSAIMENVYDAAYKMARTIAVCRTMAPNEEEANGIEATLIQLFHHIAGKIYRDDLPEIEAKLAIARARADAEKSTKKEG